MTSLFVGSRPSLRRRAGLALTQVMALCYFTSMEICGGVVYSLKLTLRRRGGEGPGGYVYTDAPQISKTLGQASSSAERKYTLETERKTLETKIDQNTRQLLTLSRETTRMIDDPDKTPEKEAVLEKILQKIGDLNQRQSLLSQKITDNSLELDTLNVREAKIKYSTSSNEAIMAGALVGSSVDLDAECCSGCFCV